MEQPKPTEHEITVAEMHREFYASKTQDECMSSARLENEPYGWYKDRIRLQKRIIKVRQKGVLFHKSRNYVDKEHYVGNTYRKPTEE